jgi:hypothetical protein
MSTHFKPAYHGERFGLKYVFDHAGEGIRMHAHTVPDNEHSTLVLKGAVTVYGPDYDVQVEEGDELFYDSTKLHEIVALIDGTEIVNIYLRGKPECLHRCSDEELSGSVDSQLKGRGSWLQ